MSAIEDISPRLAVAGSSLRRGAKHRRVEARLAQSDGVEHAYQGYAGLLAPLRARPVAPVDGVPQQRGQVEDAPAEIILRERLHRGLQINLENNLLGLYR